MSRAEKKLQPRLTPQQYEQDSKPRHSPRPAPPAPAQKKSLTDQFTDGLDAALGLFADFLMTPALNNTTVCSPAAVMSMILKPMPPMPVAKAKAEQEYQPVITPRRAPTLGMH